MYYELGSASEDYVVIGKLGMGRDWRSNRVGGKRFLLMIFHGASGGPGLRIWKSGQEQFHEQWILYLYQF
jgi:hypothetical protein